MTQTKTQIKTQLNQFLADIQATASLPNSGYPSSQAIYQTILAPSDNDSLDTLRAKLYLLTLTIDNRPDLDQDLAHNIQDYADQINMQYYADQIDYNQPRPTFDDLPL